MMKRDIYINMGFAIAYAWVRKTAHEKELLTYAIGYASRNNKHIYTPVMIRDNDRKRKFTDERFLKTRERNPRNLSFTSNIFIGSL
jgi:hypothetical protein